MNKKINESIKKDKEDVQKELDNTTKAIKRDLDKTNKELDDE